MCMVIGDFPSLDSLSERLCENISRSRAVVLVSPESINQFFDNLTETLNDIDPQLIVNYDETAMVDDPGRCKVIVKRGQKHPKRMIDLSKSSVSVMFSGSASGHLL